MPSTIEWPNRIYIEEEHHAKYHELQSKGESDTVPFKAAKEVFMYSVILGFLNNRKIPTKSKKEVIFEHYLDSSIDKPLLECIYLIGTKQDEAILDKKSLTETMQEYANGGFELLYDIVSKGYDKVEALSHYLIQNHIQGSPMDNST
jgi:hypothetical protein